MLPCFRLRLLIEFILAAYFSISSEAENHGLASSSNKHNNTKSTEYLFKKRPLYRKTEIVSKYLPPKIFPRNWDANSNIAKQEDRVYTISMASNPNQGSVSTQKNLRSNTKSVYDSMSRVIKDSTGFTLTDREMKPEMIASTMRNEEKDGYIEEIYDIQMPKDSDAPKPFDASVKNPVLRVRNISEELKKRIYLNRRDPVVDETLIPNASNFFAKYKNHKIINQPENMIDAVDYEGPKSKDEFSSSARFETTHFKGLQKPTLKPSGAKAKGVAPRPPDHTETDIHDIMEFVSTASEKSARMSQPKILNVESYAPSNVGKKESPNMTEDGESYYTVKKEGSLNPIRDFDHSFNYSNPNNIPTDQSQIVIGDAVSLPFDYISQETMEKYKQGHEGEGQLDQVEEDVTSDDPGYDKQTPHQIFQLSKIASLERSRDKNPENDSSSRIVLGDAISLPSDYFSQETMKKYKKGREGEGRTNQIEEDVTSDDLGYNKQTPQLIYPLNKIASIERSGNKNSPNNSGSLIVSGNAIRLPPDYLFKETIKKYKKDYKGMGQFDQIEDEEEIPTEITDHNKSTPHHLYALKGFAHSKISSDKEPQHDVGSQIVRSNVLRLQPDYLLQETLTKNKKGYKGLGRLDQIEENIAFGKPSGYSNLIPDLSNSLVYANRRFYQDHGSGSSECVIGTNSGCNDGEECSNRAGVESCECSRPYGRRYTQRYSWCQPIKYSFWIEIYLWHPFQDEFLDRSNIVFLSFADALLSLLEFIISRNRLLNSFILATRVIKFRPGSTIASVVFDLNYNAVVIPGDIQKILADELRKNVPSNDIGFLANSLHSIRAISLCDRAEINPCSHNADCLTKNQYEFAGCACKRGYNDVSPINAYPGSVCSKFSGECEAGSNTGCGPEEVCIVNRDGNACVCQPPFVKNAITGECEIVGSCEPYINNGCGANEVCQPQGIGATCICSPGFTRNLLNGYCQTMQGDQCNVHSQIGCKIYAKEKCVLIDGRGVCVCIYGYYRDAYTHSCQRVHSECDPITENGCPDGERCVYNYNITVCECLPGYFRNAHSQTCVSDVPTVKVRIHLLLMYVPGLENIYSPSFQYLQNSLLEAFWYVVHQDSDLNGSILDIIIIKFSPGSIIAETRFILKPQANVSAKYIRKSIQNAVIPQEPMFQSLRFKDATIEAEEENPCSDSRLNHCSANASCFLTTGSTYECRCLSGYWDVSGSKNMGLKYLKEKQRILKGRYEMGIVQRNCHLKRENFPETKNSSMYDKSKGHQHHQDRYRKLSLTSERPNLVESMLSVGLIDNSVTLSTSPNSDNNRDSYLSPIAARYKNNGSPLRIITRNSYRLVKQGADYIPWWHHSPSTNEDDPEISYVKEANAKIPVVDFRGNARNFSSGFSNPDSNHEEKNVRIYARSTKNCVPANYRSSLDKKSIHQNSQKAISSKSKNASHNAIQRNDTHANRDSSHYLNTHSDNPPKSQRVPEPPNLPVHSYKR
ncbi:unnamed protein product [Gordionus sp. m RMFG-2023]